MQSTFAWKCSLESSCPRRSLVVFVQVIIITCFISVIESICFPNEGNNSICADV
jgi:hypothetical protein